MSQRIDRRELLRAGAASLALAGGGCMTTRKDRRPNILFVHTDQQGFDTLSGLGTEYVRTPNMDRLLERGTLFRESHCQAPVCMPARTAWYTGRPSLETGVHFNLLPLRADIPDMGAWLRDAGYESVYAGKWHVPGRDYNESFRVLVGKAVYGEFADPVTTRVAADFLRNHAGRKPFFLNVGLIQPHDINYWIRLAQNDFEELPYPELADELPPLPPNFHHSDDEPESFRNPHRVGRNADRVEAWSETQWRHYLWIYYRHVEMVDAEIGLLLEALEDSGHASDTVVIFSSDHGDGMARHGLVSKGFLYDEVLRVPLVVSWPGELAEGAVDHHLVSGLDVAPTLCDIAGTPPPAEVRGTSFLPFARGEDAEWREYLVAECAVKGRVVRSPRYKLITYAGDETSQLFDMEADPWETQNLARDPGHAEILARHVARIAEWERGMDVAPEPPGGWVEAKDPDVGQQ